MDDDLESKAAAGQALSSLLKDMQETQDAFIGSPGLAECLSLLQARRWGRGGGLSSLSHGILPWPALADGLLGVVLKHGAPIGRRTAAGSSHQSTGRQPGHLAACAARAAAVRRALPSTPLAPPLSALWGGPHGHWGR